MRKFLSVFLAMTLCLLVGLSLTGCAGSEEEPSEAEQETVNDTLEEDAEPVEEEPVASGYDKYAKYLSDFKAVDGGGYTVTVDDSIKGDFTTLEGCGMYTMKKAYEEYGTMEMGVFGTFSDATTAFAYDSTWGEDRLYVYDEDGTTPPGWYREFYREDIQYFMGEK